MKSALLVWMVGSLVLSSLAVADAVRAQIVPDNTLPENSRVETRCTVCTIDGGTTQGNNLFHSFREFSVPTGGEANFNNAPQIENILTRVTGDSVSNIDGLLRSNGTANLFLINPNGVIFGPNARLDIGGSFLTSTADAIAFPNDETFSATNPTPPNELLTVNPNALLFNQLNPQPIINRSIANTTGLTASPGASVALVGGDVRLEGGRIRAAGGRVELGGVREPGAVGLNVDRANLSLSFSDTVARADVLLNNNAQVNVRASGGGDVVINARDFTMLGLDTQLLAGIGPGLGFVGAQAGNIAIDTSGMIRLDTSRIFNTVPARAIGNGGNINIRAESIIATNALISTSVVGRGNAGNITITTGTLSLANGAEIVSNMRGRGDAGDITVNARDTILISGVTQDRFPVFSGIISIIGNGGVGEGGNITITTDSLYVTDGAILSSATNEQGNAGNIVIRARDRVVFDGVSSNGFSSGATSDVESEEAVGNGGDIQIQARLLTISNGASISAGTRAQGRAGNVVIDADEVQVLGGVVGVTVKGELIAHDTGIFTGTEGAATGRGGDIRITTNRLYISDGSVLGAQTSSDQPGGDIRIDANTIELNSGGEVATNTVESGNAGNIRVNASDRIILRGFDPDFDENIEWLGEEQVIVATAFSGFFAQTEGTGEAGNIQVQTPELIVRNRAQIVASTTEQGRGGNLIINAPDRVLLSNSQLSVATNGNARAGDLTIDTANLTLNGGQIFASSTGSGAAGNLNVTAESVLLSDRARIAASSTGSGAAGNLNVTADSVLLSDRARIAVDSQGSGVAGNIDITAAEVQLDDQARLTAETATTNGGNITLRDVEVLQLSNNSLISTTAGTAQAGGDGGNIDIDADFIVALPNGNSDIRANAFSGSGGNVSITTEGLFGIVAQPQDNPFTSDITASSQQGVQGTVDITTPDVDPGRGLTELPADVVEASDQIALGCSPSATAQINQGEFYQTGRGGIAPSPIDAIGSSDILEDLQPPDSWTTAAPTAAPIQEAQGWQVNDRNQVELVAATQPQCGR